MTVSERQSHFDAFRVAGGTLTQGRLHLNAKSSEDCCPSLQCLFFFTSSPDLWSRLTTKSFYAVIRYFRGRKRAPSDAAAQYRTTGSMIRETVSGARPLKPSRYCTKYKVV